MQLGAVLIVDENTELTSRLAGSLESSGWEVRVAPTGSEARALLREQNFAAMVLDVELPDTDGLVLLEQLRDEGSCPVALLLAAHLDVQTAVRAIRAGAYDVLEKPLDPAFLDERLRAGLTGRHGFALRARPNGNDAASQIFGECAAIQAVREQVRDVARFRDLSVVIIGEVGTGKQLVASAIHALSDQSEPFVAVNCAAIPEQMFESELFGSESSGGEAQLGMLETAAAGTVFLDEMEALPLLLQPQLLRLLEDRVLRRGEGERERPFRARVVSAAQRRWNAGDGAVHSDLYFRLSGFTIQVPPLRERGDDIELLANKFLTDFAARYPEASNRFAPNALEPLYAYDWPGNVRELKTVVQQAAVLTHGPLVGSDELSSILRDRRTEREFTSPPGSNSRMRAATPIPLGEPLRVLERRVIEEAWQSSGQNLSAAARKLGLPRTTLRDRLRKYGLR